MTTDEQARKTLANWLGRHGRASKTCRRARDGEEVMLHMRAADVIAVMREFAATTQRGEGAE